MSVTMKDVMTEVDAIILARLEQELDTPLSMIKHLVLSAHTDIDGTDADWHRFLSADALDDVVRKVVGKYKATHEAADDQLLMPGFTHLQKGYSIDRHGEPTVVSIRKMTNEEGGAKIQEYRRMAHGCLKHADELERYFTQRSAA